MAIAVHPSRSYSAWDDTGQADDGGISTLASFVVEQGQAGAQQI